MAGRAGVPKLLEMRTEADSVLWTAPGLTPNVSSPSKMLFVPVKMAASKLQPLSKRTHTLTH